ncbi:MAG: NAD-dependent epimerase/dehydratase family protein [bacterium]|nr:NAD-dependent epimerase/dehydratase family protein [bacterium]
MKKNPKTTIVVTGCAGFIGSNFISTYLKRFPTHHIVGIDDFSSGKREALSPHITFYETSITNKAEIHAIFKKHTPQYVFHFAAIPRVSYSVEHPIESSEANIIGTITILDAAATHGVLRVINSSSSSVYGGAKHLPTKEAENPPNPQSPYAAQKLSSEIFCALWSSLYGLDTVSLRYFNVYGPGQYGDSPYSTVVSAWLEGLYFPSQKHPFIEGTGNRSRDLSYIENVVHANILAAHAKKPLKGAAINIGNGERHTIKEVGRLIEKYSGRKLVLEKRPSRKGDVTHTHANCTLAKKRIGYTPIVPFEEGLQRTVAWFKERIGEE